MTQKSCDHSLKEIITTKDPITGNVEPCMAFSKSTQIHCQSSDAEQCKIQPFHPGSGTDDECFTASSANKPVFIQMQCGLETHAQKFVLKTHFNPKNDVIATEFAKFLVQKLLPSAYSSESEAPIIVTYDAKQVGKPNDEFGLLGFVENVDYIQDYHSRENKASLSAFEQVKSENCKDWNFKQVDVKPIITAMHPDYACHTDPTKMRNFMRSLRGTFILQQLLQIKDRHFGNIVMNKDCLIWNIDFKFIFGNKPLREQGKLSMALNWWSGAGLNGGDYNLPYSFELDAYLTKINQKEEFFKALTTDLHKIKSKLLASKEEMKEHFALSAAKHYEKPEKIVSNIESAMEKMSKKTLVTKYDAQLKEDMKQMDVKIKTHFVEKVYGKFGLDEKKSCNTEDREWKKDDSGDENLVEVWKTQSKKDWIQFTVSGVEKSLIPIFDELYGEKRRLLTTLADLNQDAVTKICIPGLLILGLLVLVLGRKNLVKMWKSNKNEQEPQRSAAENNIV